MAQQTALKRLIGHKKTLNACAELGWSEVKTTSYIDSVIKDRPLVEGFSPSHTGRLYRLGKGNRHILFRADIDALKSGSGIAHTCGHSTHTSALLEAYRYAKERIDEVNERDLSLYFLFQPAEETFPSGADSFVHECPLLVKKLHAAHAIHVRPLMEKNVIGLQPGLLWARGDYMEVAFRGKMVHIKNNGKGKDAIFAAALFICGVNKIQTESPGIRIGIGVASGGRQANTVADEALLKGDIRLPSDADQKNIKNKLIGLLSRVESDTGVKTTLRYFEGTPPVVNDATLTDSIVSYMSSRTDLPFRYVKNGLFSYGCEDFAYISSRVPSTVALIGTGDKHDLHEEKCTVSDAGTINSYRYFCAVVDYYLHGQ